MCWHSGHIMCIAFSSHTLHTVLLHWSEVMPLGPVLKLKKVGKRFMIISFYSIHNGIITGEEVSMQGVTMT